MSHRWVKYLKVPAILALTALFVILNGDFSSAQLEDIIFRADHQRHIREDSVVVLSGNVHITYQQNMEFYCDEARLDDVKKEFWGTGNVRIEGDDRLIYADNFWYNYDRDDFEVINASGMIMVGGVSEPVNFVSRKIRGNLNDYKLISSTLTTCERDERQEYHMEAKMVKVLPDNKVILRNALFFIGKIPIFYFPYFVYSLRETPFEIQVGKSRTEGTYVKVKYNYLYEENIVGAIIFHYLSRLGWRFGADHSYYIENQGEGKFNFLYLNRKETAGGKSNFSADTSQRLRFSKQLTGDVGLNQVNDVDIYSGKSRNDFRFRMNLANQTPSSNASASYNYNSQKGTTSSSSSQAQVQYRRSWKKRNLDINTNANLNRTNTSTEDANGNKADDQELTTSLSVTKRKDLYDWEMRMEKRYDVDGHKYVGDSNRSFFDRIPEVKLNLKPEIFSSDKETEYKDSQDQIFEIRRIELKGALYYDRRQDKTVQGLFGKFSSELASQEIPVGESSKFNGRVTYTQNITSTGDAQYNYSPTISYRKDFSKKLKMDMNWQKTEANGRCPFVQEASGGGGNSISWNMNLTDNKWTHRWSTNYQLQNDTWQNLSYNLTYRSGNRFTYVMNTAYSLERGDWSPLNNTVNITNNRSYSSDFNLTYDIQNGKLTTFSNTTKLLIAKDWDLEFVAQYTGRGNREPLIKDIYLNKRNDCTFVQLKYDASNDAFMISVGITAYPALSYSYRNNDQGLRSTLPGFSSGGFNFGGEGFGSMFGGGGYYGGGSGYSGGGGGYYSGF